MIWSFALNLIQDLKTHPPFLYISCSVFKLSVISSVVKAEVSFASQSKSFQSSDRKQFSNAVCVILKVQSIFCIWIDFYFFRNVNTHKSYMLCIRVEKWSYKLDIQRLWKKIFLDNNFVMLCKLDSSKSLS